MPKRDIEQRVAADFAKDIATHAMTVELDNGVYRSLRFASTGEHPWNQWFRIVTYPGELVITGDMSTFVFSRTDDMFEFFRNDGGRVNLSYWSEKLVAHAKHSGHREFSEELFEANVAEAVKNYLEFAELSEEQRTELNDIITDEVLPLRHDGEYGAIRAMMDVEIAGQRPFAEFYEWNNREYTYHFVWCCHAIVWAIQQYDAMKDAETAKAAA